MKRLRAALLFTVLLFTAAISRAQQDAWPRMFTANDGTIVKVYQPQPESFDGNILKSRSVISIQADENAEPLFGTFWAVATVQTDRVNRRISVLSVHVPNLRFALDTDANKIMYIKTTLEAQLPNAVGDLSLDAITTALDTDTEQKKLSKGLNNNVPKILYSNRPSILVTIDGAPKLQHNKDWGVDAVVNTPFTIVKNNDGNFYLYGQKHWYQAASATGPYRDAGTDVPGNLQQIADAVNSSANTDPGYSNDSTAVDSDGIADIIVSTQPAELIQTNGNPVFTPIDGTQLQYASNTDNDIFINQADQQYYVLLSGRWYKSSSLQGPWVYNASNAMPADFARIPEGSPKDNVLASIAGTDAAREAVMDAQIPQTAKVDRHNAQADVTYDGQPDFDNIDGTDMQYAVNTQNSVIRYRGTYYVVDKGVWFESFSPNGPWSVCTERPAEVDIIPPSSPVYNVKYVYIYDATPDWVYTGYTPGYLNTFIYGPTVVYGTGFYYQPWFGNYYYPRPYTWGFGVQYNPYIGFSLGWGYGYGWFNSGYGGYGGGYGGYGRGGWGGWHGGWWGPSVYRPPYRWGGDFRRGGYYGNRLVASNNARNNVRVYNNINIYNNRRNVVTSNRITPTQGRLANNRNNNTRLNNNGRGQQNVYSDRQGNVYERNAQGQWQQRNQRQWTPVNNNAQIQNLNRQNQLRTRGEARTQTFENVAPVQRQQAPIQRQQQPVQRQQAPVQRQPQQQAPVQRQQAPVQRQPVPAARPQQQAPAPRQQPPARRP